MTEYKIAVENRSATSTTMVNVLNKPPVNNTVGPPTAVTVSSMIVSYTAFASGLVVSVVSFCPVAGLLKRGHVVFHAIRDSTLQVSTSESLCLLPKDLHRHFLSQSFAFERNCRPHSTHETAGDPAFVTILWLPSSNGRLTMRGRILFGTCSSRLTLRSARSWIVWTSCWAH